MDEPHYEILELEFEIELVSTEAAVLPDKKTSCSFAIEHALFNQSISSLFLSFFPLHSFLIRQVLLTFTRPLTTDSLKNKVLSPNSTPTET